MCGAIAEVDERVPCVVGPTPYYKIWQLNRTMLLHSTDGRPMPNVVYTFDFFEPWDFVTVRAMSSRTFPFPGYWAFGTLRDLWDP